MVEIFFDGRYTKWLQLNAIDSAAVKRQDCWRGVPQGTRLCHSFNRLYVSSSAPFPGRMLHSPSLMDVSLSVGYGQHPIILWGVGMGQGLHRHFVIGCCKYRLGLHRSQWVLGSRERWGFPLTFPFHSPNGRQMPTDRAVRGDCERIYPFPGVWVAFPHQTVQKKTRIKLIASRKRHFQGHLYQYFSHD